MDTGKLASRGPAGSMTAKYELWECFEYDGCVEPIVLLGSYNDMFSATAAAVACRRPGIEVLMDSKPFKHWLSHTINPNGSWHHAFGPKDA